MSCVISVIIPCYNHGAYLEEAIQSVEENIGSYACEIIIVDDGSSDALTLKVLASLIQRGYNVLQQKNQGLAAARNNGIALAKGEFILPLDSDNKIDKNYLTKAVEVLKQNSTIEVVYGKAMFFGNSDEVRKLGLREVGEFNFTKMLYANYIDACALFRKSTWSRVGGYDGKMPEMGHEDWEMWVNIFLSGGKFYFLQEVGFYYRVVAGSMLTTGAEMKHDRNKDYIYEKHSLKIIKWLLPRTTNFETSMQYMKDNKLLSIAKLALGYNI
jgi:glycosyltransferase involved in cell wall biosynthesis